MVAMCSLSIHLERNAGKGFFHADNITPTTIGIIGIIVAFFAYAIQHFSEFYFLGYVQDLEQDKRDLEQGTAVGTLLHKSIEGIVQLKSEHIRKTLKALVATGQPLTAEGVLVNMLNPRDQMQTIVSRLQYFLTEKYNEPRIRVSFMVRHSATEDGLRFEAWEYPDHSSPMSNQENLIKSFKKGETVAGRAWADGQLKIVDDPNDPNSGFVPVHQNHKHKIKTMFSLPILDTHLEGYDTLVGIINADSPTNVFRNNLKSRQEIEETVDPFAHRLRFENRALKIRQLILKE